MRERIEGRGSMITRVLAGLLLLLPLGLAPRPAAAQQLRRPGVCAECHQNLDASKERALGHTRGKQAVSCQSCHHVGFASDRSTSVARRDEACKSCHTQLAPTHRDVSKNAPSCSSCHTVHGDKALPDPAARVAVSQRCASCHTTPHKLHASVTKNAPECTDCHSAHGAQPLRAADAATSQKCASCHKDAHPSHTGEARARLDGQCTSCHGVDGSKVASSAQLTAACASCHKTVPAETRKLVVAAGGVQKGAPGCADCHDFAKDGKVAQAAPAISERCGACHTDALAKHRTGAHARALAAQGRNGDLPTCVSCHSGHQAHSAGVEQADIRLAATTRCIACHSDARLAKKYDLKSTVGASYTRDYHGATLKFESAGTGSGAGQKDVMTCSDCHGAHAVTANDQAAQAAVCLRCHKEGDTKLAGAWLGHTPASPTNRPLIWLVRLFYFVLIPFELIGLTLVIFYQLRDQRRKGARPLTTPGMLRLRERLRGRKPEPVATVTRFNVRERVEHLLSMTSFIMLVVTGLPQTRPSWAFCRDIIAFFGGIGGTRLVHRITGVVFVLMLITHVARAIIVALRKQRMPIMVPSKQDFVDTLATIKHYIYGTPKPKTPKFDASEKFEYWGLFLGGTLMCVTGLALMFPELITRFVPGILLAAMRVMHGLEATFAVSVIALWHSYGVSLRPEVFPLDTSIFTGKMSVERLEEEHELEYERIFGEEAGKEEEEEELAYAD